MSYADADKYQLFRVKRFFDGLDRESRKNGQLEITCFDGVASDMLALILNRCTEAGKDKTPAPSVKISSYTFAKICHSSRRRVRYRLEKLASYGLLKIQSDWRNDGSNKRNTQTITPHPWLFYLVAVGAKPAHKMQAIKQFVGLGISRLESEEPVQGFRYDVPVGEVEPAEAEVTQAVGQGVDSQTEEKLNEMIAVENKGKAQKQRDAAAWRNKGDDFINGCSSIWTWAQGQMGNGRAAPSWGGDRKMLAPSCSRERQELVKLFQAYGGRTTALAWYVFAGGTPEIDDKTMRPKFTITAPHRQYASMDKRPSQFAKYFNAILADSFFKRFATKEWNTVEPALRSYFGPILDQKPRDAVDDEARAGVKYGELPVNPRMEISL